MVALLEEHSISNYGRKVHVKSYFMYIIYVIFSYRANEVLKFVFNSFVY